jgi:hypothetical protein
MAQSLVVGRGNQRPAQRKKKENNPG